MVEPALYPDPPPDLQYKIFCLRVAAILNCRADEVGTLPLDWVYAARAELNARAARSHRE